MLVFPLIELEAIAGLDKDHAYGDSAFGGILQRLLRYGGQCHVHF